MLSVFYKSLQMNMRPYVCSHVATLNYHNSSVKYSKNVPSLSTFTADEELKIVNTINTSSINEFENYNIKTSELKKLLAYRDKNGKFDTFDEILMTQNVPSLIKLCRSILSEKKIIRKVRAPIPKSLTTPVIDELSKHNIKKIMGLHIFGNRICWATMNEHRVLSSWDFKTFQNPSKSSLVSFINEIMGIISELPYADTYVMESDQYTSLSKLKPATYSIHLQRQQVIAALISILGMRERSDDDKFQPINNFYMLRARAAAQRYNLAVGSEVISSESVVDKILAASFDVNEEKTILVDPDLISKYKSNSAEIREQLNSVLLVTLTFSGLIDDKKSVKT